MFKLEPDIETHGAVELLSGPLAVVLNSRQGKMPVGDEPWVQNTVAAVKDACAGGYTAIASIGMNTWELALWAAGDVPCNTIVLIPKEEGFSIEDKAGLIATDFQLNEESTLWLAIPPASGTRGKKGWWDRRDKLAFAMAGRTYPVSIRSDGRWAELLQSPDAESKEIRNEFRVEYTKSRKSVPIIPKGFVIPEIRPWHFLTHWTRRSYSPWPGEISADFYRDIVESVGEYARSAAASLVRILAENIIKCSPERIRGERKAVAFTALPPDEALDLMRWRPRFIRPTFEPYGICIRLKAARDAGIKPVEYLPQGLESRATPQALQQGFGRGSWPAEMEWRALEDVDLGRFNPDDVHILVPTGREMPRFQAVSRFRVSALEDLKPI